MNPYDDPEFRAKIDKIVDDELRRVSRMMLLIIIPGSVLIGLVVHYFTR